MNTKEEFEVELAKLIVDAAAMFIYLNGEDVVIELSNNVEYKERAFNNSDFGRYVTRIHHQIICFGLNAFTKPPKPVAAWKILLDHIPVATRRCHVFAESPVIENYQENGSTYIGVNMWRGSSLEPFPTYRDGDADMWVRHVKAIIPQYADLLLDWMAWIVQNPERKIRWAPLIQSEQGVGKDSMVKPLHEIFGHHNTTEVSAGQVDGSFNDFDKAKFVVLNELRSDVRYSTYNKLKARITGTGNGMVSINEKHMKPYFARNLSAWIVFTNDGDALAMDKGDRRFAVLSACYPVPADERHDYFQRFHSWYEHDEGCAKVYAYLIRRNLTSFNPDQPPEASKAKEQMQMESMTEAGRWVHSLATVGTLRDRGVTTNVEILHLAKLAGKDLRDITPKRINEGMSHAGWIKGGHQPFEGGRVATFQTPWWIAPKLGFTKFCADVRQKMFAEIGPRLATTLMDAK